MRIAVVTSTMKSGEQGGAEAFYSGLVRSLRETAHEVDQIQVEIDESSFDAILASYLRCYDLDLDSYDLVVSTKAPTYMVRHRNHVSYLVHTIRVFYDMFSREYGGGTSEQRTQRSLVQALDKAGLHPDRIRRHLAIGHTPYERLVAADPWWRAIPYEAVHLPPALTGFREPRPGTYLFLPGRLHRWKRVALAIDAVRCLDRDIELRIAGTGEDEPELRALAGDDPRITFLGRVSDEQLLDLYAGALAVPFVPAGEDFGLVTVEAFMARKPVITCSDSGEPTHFVRDYETGFVVDPQPQALADRIAYMIDHPVHTAEMGRQGYALARHITWDGIAATILAAGGAAQSPGEGRSYHALPGTAPLPAVPRLEAVPASRNGHAHNHSMAAPVGDPSSARAGGVFRVTVLDMQPIDPPVGGGRLRLLGLYHHLGERLPTRYIGSYDWPGPPYRAHHLSPTLEEIDVPLSPAHLEACGQWQQQVAGKGIVDVSFDLLAHHSPEYVEAARHGVEEADIVVCSHPWVYPLVKEQLKRSSQLLVYDSQNVEGLLRATLLDDGALGTRLVRHVVRVEHELCHAADLILACSHEDRHLFHTLYDVPFSKILVVPNGTFTHTAGPGSAAARADIKQRLALPNAPLAVFVGSAYQPNVEAAAFICRTVAPALPDVTFAICGDVGDALRTQLAAVAVGANVRITGRLEECDLSSYLAAADVALNPIFSGSGTNVKMFHYMAQGLPIVTTATGARGIIQGTEPALHTCAVEDFVPAIRRILQDHRYEGALRQEAFRLVEQRYSWRRISAQLGARLHRARAILPNTRPFFTVIVATYERQRSLASLLTRLRAQTDRDFEVIIVDQSTDAWHGHAEFPDLDIVYIHSDVRGAVGARNAAAFLASGEVLAFTDDDCEPEPEWLACGRRYLADPGVVGVEGLIVSDLRDHPDYRAVTNTGFEGIGFMTANLLLRRETFMAIDGFDERFDHPHFREDTDLGWRALEYGRIPFAHDVRVYHPPHRRDSQREGSAERNRFFEKDALLMSKHPERYRTLFHNECNYLHAEGFREHFLRGAEKHGVPIDEHYLALLTPHPHGEPPHQDARKG